MQTKAGIKKTERKRGNRTSASEQKGTKSEKGREKMKFDLLKLWLNCMSCIYEYAAFFSVNHRTTSEIIEGIHTHMHAHTHTQNKTENYE